MQKRKRDSNENSNEEKQEYQEILEFLFKIDQQQHFDKFIEEGFDSLDILKDIEEKDLKGMNINEFDTRIIMEAIKKLSFATPILINGLKEKIKKSGEENNLMATIIGTNYTKENGWIGKLEIISCENDSKLMCSSLPDNQKYITRLRNQEDIEENYRIRVLNKPKLATREIILKRLDFVLRNSKESDIIFFYFSGHGRIMKLRNGDICFSLVLVDSNLKEEKTEKEEEIIPNDIYLDAINGFIEYALNKQWNGKEWKQLSVQRTVVIVLDSCFSGSILDGNFNVNSLQKIGVESSNKILQKENRYSGINIKEYEWICEDFKVNKIETEENKNENLFCNLFNKDAILFCGSRGNQKAIMLIKEKTDVNQVSKKAPISIFTESLCKILKSKILLNSKGRKGYIPHSWLELKRKTESDFYSSNSQFVDLNCLIHINYINNNVEAFGNKSFARMLIPVVAAKENIALIDCGYFHGVKPTTKFAVFSQHTSTSPFTKGNQIGVASVVVEDVEINKFLFEKYPMIGKFLTKIKLTDGKLEEYQTFKNHKVVMIEDEEYNQFLNENIVLFKGNKRIENIDQFLNPSKELLNDDSPSNYFIYKRDFLNANNLISLNSKYSPNKFKTTTITILLCFKSFGANVLKCRIPRPLQEIILQFVYDSSEETNKIITFKEWFARNNGESKSFIANKLNQIYWKEKFLNNFYEIAKEEGEKEIERIEMLEKIGIKFTEKKEILPTKIVIVKQEIHSKMNEGSLKSKINLLILNNQLENENGIEFFNFRKGIKYEIEKNSKIGFIFKKNEVNNNWLHSIRFESNSDIEQITSSPIQLRSNFEDIQEDAEVCFYFVDSKNVNDEIYLNENKDDSKTKLDGKIMKIENEPLEIVLVFSSRTVKAIDFDFKIFEFKSYSSQSMVKMGQSKENVEVTIAEDMQSNHHVVHCQFTLKK